MGLSDRTNIGKHTIPPKSKEKGKGLSHRTHTSSKTVLTTVYDSLYKEIQQQPIDLFSLASHHNATIEEMKRRIHILEQKKMVELYYPIFGKPIVRIPLTANPMPQTPASKKKRLILFTITLVVLMIISILLYIYLTQ
jgi:hypothetical protein